jgi:hypothetical protein
MASILDPTNPWDVRNSATQMADLEPSVSHSSTFIEQSSSLQIRIAFKRTTSSLNSESTLSQLKPPPRPAVPIRQRRYRPTTSDSERFMIFPREGLNAKDRSDLTERLRRTWGVSDLNLCGDFGRDIWMWTAMLSPRARLEISKDRHVLGMVLDGPDEV